MSILTDISAHKGLTAAVALGLAAAARATFVYTRTLSPTAADKAKPFSDDAMLEIRSDIDQRKAGLGVKARTEEAHL